MVTDSNVKRTLCKTPYKQTNRNTCFAHGIISTFADAQAVIIDGILPGDSRHDDLRVLALFITLPNINYAQHVIEFVSL